MLLNRGLQQYEITANWDDIGIPPKSAVQARDLWQVLLDLDTFNSIQFMLFCLITLLFGNAAQDIEETFCG